MFRKQLIALYLFIRRIFRGKGLSRIRFIRNINFSVEKFLKGGVLTVVIKNGLTIYLDPRESLAEKVRSKEPESTALIKKYLLPGDIFVDVGASIGWYTLHAAKIVGEHGKVYAFEPEPNSFGLLKKNVDANGFQNAVLRQAAVCDRHGKVKLYVPGNAWFWSSLEDPRNDYKRNIEANFSDKEDKTVYEYEVESIRLDDVLPAKVDFMKIDVEADRITNRAFDGTVETIRRNSNLKLLIEHPTEKIIKTLKSLGYSYLFVDLDGVNGFFIRH